MGPIASLAGKRSPYLVPCFNIGGSLAKLATWISITLFLQFQVTVSSPNPYLTNVPTDSSIMLSGLSLFSIPWLKLPLSHLRGLLHFLPALTIYISGIIPENYRDVFSNYSTCFIPHVKVDSIPRQKISSNQCPSIRVLFHNENSYQFKVVNFYSGLPNLLHSAFDY